MHSNYTDHEMQFVFVKCGLCWSLVNTAHVQRALNENQQSTAKEIVTSIKEEAG